MYLIHTVYSMFLPTWWKKTGKSSQMTVLNFLCLGQGCKISDMCISFAWFNVLELAKRR